MSVKPEHVFFFNCMLRSPFVPTVFANTTESVRRNWDTDLSQLEVFRIPSKNVLFSRSIRIYTLSPPDIRPSTATTVFNYALTLYPIGALTPVSENYCYTKYLYFAPRTFTKSFAKEVYESARIIEYSLVRNVAMQYVRTRYGENSI